MESDSDETYLKYLKIMLLDITLLKNIAYNQLLFCVKHPDRIRQMKQLYSLYPHFDEKRAEVEHFIRYIQIITNYLLANTITNKNINIYTAFYNKSYLADSIQYFENIMYTIDSLIIELNDILKNDKYYNFETHKISFSSMSMHDFFEDRYKQAIGLSQLDKDLFKQSYLFKSYVLKDYRDTYITDSIDTKLNGQYYDRYTEDYMSMLFNI